MVARANGERHGASVRWLAVDLTNALRLDHFDLVVSNPPYIDPSAEISPEVRDFDPHLALFAPDRGRGVLAQLLSRAATMRSGASLLLEIGHDQGDWITAQIAESDALELLEIRQDYAGIARSVHARRR